MSDSPRTPRSETVLSLEHVTKRFRSAVALDDVSFAVAQGTVHALLGENGAGKTTLMRIAFGILSPDAGSAIVRGRRIDSTAGAIDAGVGMVHQHFTNVPAMTVAENVALGRRGRYDARRARTVVREVGQHTGLALDPDERAEDLSVGAQQRLEIVKALARDANVLILDEPTAVLAPAEAVELLRWLRRFANEGNAVVIITHKLREALAIADEVTVLRRGRAVLRERADHLDEATLAAAMLGGDAGERTSGATSGMVGETVARLRNIRVHDARGAVRLSDVSLDVRAREILGIAAVEGAGQNELLRVIAGRLQPDDGDVDVPDDAAFVPEDRHRDALILDFDATENIALRGVGRRAGTIPWRRERDRARQLIESFDVRGGAPGGSVRALSGGNQQKLVIARELEGSPSLLVAENPTRGLDIRATQSVHAIMREMAARGGAVVLYSSDLDEVLSLATRVVALHRGQLRETSTDRDEVGKAMLGVT